MMDLLAGGQERTTGELAAAFPRLSRFAIMKHLRVLQRAGLLIARRQGRKRYNQLNVVPLREVMQRWMGKYQEFWADAMINLRDAAETQSPRKRDS
jgi:DNA-binding transcriptional ArsR family regulator